VKSDETSDVFEAERSRLFGLAYRLLGSAAEAEDVVQDAWLRWNRSVNVDVPAAWLTKVVTNLSLNVLTSARVRRAAYPGPWLPEPVRTDAGALGPVETVEQRESVSYGLLVLLERLTPAERAVFVLREAFGHSHREVADILGVSENHSRQLHLRARERVAGPHRRHRADPAAHRRIVERFMAATLHGDVAALETLLADDVVAWMDGGGTTAARRPVHGRDRVLRYLLGLSRRPEAGRVEIVIAEVNGEPAALLWDEGVLRAVMVLDAEGDRVVRVRTIAAVAKLAAMG